MLFKMALILWTAAFLVGLFTRSQERIAMAKLALGGLCLLLLAALVRLLKF
jgi:hypothetical protein